MKWFKRTPKPKRHTLKDFYMLPQYHLNWRALKCEECGKHFIMDMFGGWGDEWTFTTDDQGRIDKEQLEDAYKNARNKPLKEWYQVDKTICEGKERGHAL